MCACRRQRWRAQTFFVFSDHGGTNDLLEFLGAHVGGVVAPCIAVMQVRHPSSLGPYNLDAEHEHTQKSYVQTALTALNKLERWRFGHLMHFGARFSQVGIVDVPRPGVIASNTSDRLSPDGQAAIGMRNLGSTCIRTRLPSPYTQAGCCQACAHCVQSVWKALA